MGSYFYSQKSKIMNSKILYCHYISHILTDCFNLLQILSKLDQHFMKMKSKYLHGNTPALFSIKVRVVHSKTILHKGLHLQTVNMASEKILLVALAVVFLFGFIQADLIEQDTPEQDAYIKCKIL